MNRLRKRRIRPGHFRRCELFKWRNVLVIYIISLAASQGAGAIELVLPQAVSCRPDAAWASAVDIDRTIDAAHPHPAATRNPSAAAATRVGSWFSRIPDKPLSGTALLLAMLVLAAATLVSEDLACIGAGLLVARGTIGITSAVAASFAGILIGDILLYLAGRHIGRPALNVPPFRWFVKESDIKRTSDWFSARGPIVILTSRFTPGLRLPTYFAAGVLGTRFWHFVFYFSLAVALWTPLLVGLSAAIGTRMFAYYDLFGRYALLIVVATVGLLWAVAKFIIPLFSYRGRRLLLSSIRRAARWEFWPPAVFYLPAVGYYVCLTLRFRSPTLFTICNPGFSTKDLVQESRSRNLKKASGSAPFIARHRLIGGGEPAAAKIGLAADFMQQHGLDYPVVLTPDDGRAESAVILRSARQLERQLSEADSDQMIREHIDGLHFRILYCRHPGAASGRIFSISEKRPVKLTGDGHSTLERLILQDDRALMAAAAHLRRQGDKLFTVLAKGEAIDLSEAGNHRSGMWRRDGGTIRTAQLDAAIDRISKQVEGFYFGLYDIVAPSVDDIRSGRKFTIVSLGGVRLAAGRFARSDASLRRAYADLMRRWRLAFEIGDANRRRGHRPASVRKLAGLVARRIAGQPPATTT